MQQDTTKPQRRKRTIRPIAPTTRLVTPAQLAREIGIPYTTIRDIVARGELTVLKVGNRWYLERAEVERWIESRKERAAAA